MTAPTAPAIVATGGAAAEPPPQMREEIVDYLAREFGAPAE